MKEKTVFPFRLNCKNQRFDGDHFSGTQTKAKPGKYCFIVEKLNVSQIYLRIVYCHEFYTFNESCFLTSLADLQFHLFSTIPAFIQSPTCNCSSKALPHLKTFRHQIDSPMTWISPHKWFKSHMYFRLPRFLYLASSRREERNQNIFHFLSTNCTA